MNADLKPVCALVSDPPLRVLQASKVIDAHLGAIRPRDKHIKFEAIRRLAGRKPREFHITLGQHTRKMPQQSDCWIESAPMRRLTSRNNLARVQESLAALKHLGRAAQTSGAVGLRLSL
jgi:hypothetical protein